jgi:hypothetical protein
MDATGISTTDLGEPSRSQYALMNKQDLESAIILAIREHRRAIEADQAVYEEWDRTASDPNSPASLVQSLQNEYMARQEKLLAQQCRLAELIDALGYVPHVGADEKDSPASD